MAPEADCSFSNVTEHEVPFIQQRCEAFSLFIMACMHIEGRGEKEGSCGWLDWTNGDGWTDRQWDSGPQTVFGLLGEVTRGGQLKEFQ